MERWVSVLGECSVTERCAWPHGMTAIAIDSAWQRRELGEWALLVVPRLLCSPHALTHPS